MNSSQIIFYIIASIILGCGLIAVTTRKIFRAAVFLLFSLLGVAALYFYLNYEFLGAVQIAVYVGGIVVLIIFSVFLTAESGADMKKAGLPRLLITILITALSAIFIIRVIITYQLHNWWVNNNYIPSGNPIEPSVKNIGRQMLSVTEHGYILPFEVVSILLLASLIGCIVIAIKPKS